jgi:hypothetical protein
MVYELISHDKPESFNLTEWAFPVLLAGVDALMSLVTAPASGEIPVPGVIGFFQSLDGVL